MESKEKCFYCECELDALSLSRDGHYAFSRCPMCGRFTRNVANNHPIDVSRDKISTYLYYSTHVEKNIERADFTNFIGTQEDYEQDFRRYPWAAWVNRETVESWWAPTFDARLDMFLYGLAVMTKYVGAQLLMRKEQQRSAMFIRRYTDEGLAVPSHEIDVQVAFKQQYLVNMKYVEIIRDEAAKGALFRLLPEGWKRVEMLNASNAARRSTMLAICHTPQNDTLLEVIREAVQEAGFTPIMAQEDTEQYTPLSPEALFQIRQARFMVADLTDQCHDVFFETGYALGLGKPVIQICNEATFKNSELLCPHTVFYQNLDDLKRRLKERINATIE